MTWILIAGFVLLVGVAAAVAIRITAPEEVMLPTDYWQRKK